MIPLVSNERFPPLLFENASTDFSAPGVYEIKDAFIAYSYHGPFLPLGDFETLSNLLFLLFRPNPRPIGGGFLFLPS